MKCLICDGRLKRTRLEMATESVVGEWQYDCPNDHFTEEFAYGASRVFVWQREFQNNDPREDSAIRWARFWWKMSTPWRWLRAQFGR